MTKILAIKGGKKEIKVRGPHFPWPLITKNSQKAVVRQLYESISIYDHSGIIKELEDKFAKFHGKKYALLTNSGTQAIHSMYVGAGLKEGDEVICPAYTFYATVTPILFTGAIPVLCDCDEYGNLDPLELSKKLTKKTKAVVVTHMWGIPANMDPIVKFCKDHNLMLFEDASHAHGATYKKRLCGTFGAAAAWSLQGQKIISGGEGGIVLTDDAEIYYRMLLFGHYNKRCRQEIPKDHKLYKYAVTGMGLKLRAHTLSTALALEQFAHLPDWLKQKRKFALFLDKEFSKINAVITPKPPYECEPSWYAYTFRIDSKKLDGLSPEKFYEALKAEGAYEADRPGSTCPLNLLPLFQAPGELFPCYEGLFSYHPGDFPRAEEFFRQAIKIPVWTRKSDTKLVRQYAKAIGKVAKNYRELI